MAEKLNFSCECGFETSRTVQDLMQRPAYAMGDREAQRPLFCGRKNGDQHQPNKPNFCGLTLQSPTMGSENKGGLALKTGDVPRQKQVLDWAVETFGPVAGHVDERAARLVEEAIEVAQAVGLPPEVIAKILDRVYSRVPGDLSQEIGGVAITLDAMAECLVVDVGQEAERELQRVLAIPKDHFKKKHADKVAAGTADLTPVS